MTKQKQPTYQKLFGSDDYYTVPNERSVLSPAAYFVDLMNLVQNNIPENTLQTRRPDLWCLLLDKQNTDIEIPKIEIVNQVLENYLSNSNGALTGTAAPKNLNQKQYPFALPYNPVLDQIRHYLAQNSTSLQHIWKNLIPEKSLNSDQTKSIQLETLGVSQEQWKQYSTQNTKKATLNPFYGLGTSDDTVNKLTPVDTFLIATGLNYDQLMALLYQDLSVSELASATPPNAIFFINVGDTSPITIENQNLQNLSIIRLDNIQRFIRLAQAIGWSFIDLDWALQTIGKIVQKTAAINNTVLPYLVWIQETKQNHGLSVNQCCAILGQLKKTGLKNGQSWFQSVFENKNIPNCPTWDGSQIWYDTPNTDQQNTQNEIQNALSAALKIDQKDLKILVSLLLNGKPSLTLTFENLAVLYRLSLLPVFTGVGINQSLVGASLVSIETSDLIKPSNFESLQQLHTFFKWLQSAPLNLGQLQFILTGTSDDLTVQNSILGKDAITNFINNLNQAIEKSLLTEKVFHQMVGTKCRRLISNLINSPEFSEQIKKKKVAQNFINEVSTQLQSIVNEILNGLYKKMYGVSPNKLYLADGIILLDTLDLAADPDLFIDAISNGFQEILRNKNISTSSWRGIITDSLSSPDQNSLEEVINATLKNYYQLQQKTFKDQLAALYKVPAKIGVVLKDWGDLFIKEFLNHPIGPDEPLPDHSHHLLGTIIPMCGLPDPGKTSLNLILKKLQRGALLITSLGLSRDEAIFFKTVYQPTSTFPIQLNSIKKIWEFKQLTKLFKDGRNSLLNSIKSDHSIDPETISKATGWSESGIKYLLANATLSEEKIQQLWQLHQYFQLAYKLHLDVQAIQAIVDLTDTNTTSCRNSADALWAGLQTQYKDQPEILTKIQGVLNEKLRDKLVALAIHQLGATLSTPTPRGLYEYFLIDVEVSAKVQTSYIKEAIAAVQLYIYRCINQLESVAVEPALSTLWEWMYAYREWQANKEVFLYPEDYIQPELRKHKTDLFAKAEASLKQANLQDPEAVEKIFREYMNGFATVANLSIVGTAAHSLVVNGINTKQLCMIGMTQQQPHHYYWRVANFTQSNTGQFEPTGWGQWEKFNIQIQPVKYDPTTNDIGALTPVFAFNKWYVFWVEQKQSGKQSSISGGITEPIDISSDPIYTVSINYSHLDFNNRWVASQELDAIPNNSTPLITQSNSTEPSDPNTAVHPIYFSSIQTLYIPYNNNIYPLTEGTLSTNVTNAYVLVTSKSNPLEQSADWLNTLYISEDNTEDNTLQLQYCKEASTINVDNAQSLSFWFQVAGTEKQEIIEGVVSVQAGYGIFIHGEEVDNGITFKTGNWYNIVISNSFLWINGNRINIYLYAVTNKGIYKFSGSSKWELVEKKNINTLCVFKSQLYAGSNNGLYKFSGNSWIQASHLFYNQSITFLYSFKSQLYAVTKSGIYKFLQNTEWELLGGNINNINTLCIFKGQLYAGGSKGLYKFSGNSWVPENTTSNNPTINALHVFKSQLYAATGSGVYKLEASGWIDDNLPFWIFTFYVFKGTFYAGGPNGVRILIEGSGWKLKKTLPHIITLCSLNEELYFGTNNGVLELSGTLIGLKNNKINQLLNVGIIDEIQLSCKSQEVLYFSEPLTDDQVTALYQNSLGKITTDFSIYEPSNTVFNSSPTNTPILGQPNWNVIQSADGGEYLMPPYQDASNVEEDVYRLNTTAINPLSQYLHQPSGINALLSITAQESDELPFSNLSPVATYIPESNQPNDQIDFTLNSAMSNYYWELFFHLPFLIGNELNTHQQFALARTWLQYIFNPEISKQNALLQTGDDYSNDRYWQFLGLRNFDNSTLAQEHTVTALQQEWNDLANPLQLSEMDEDPFDPQEIASLRPIAYQKTIVMHYVQNLIDWGDKLYRENTRESIVEAEMFYVTAYDLLGQEPVDMGEMPLPPESDYKSPTIGKHIQGIPKKITCTYSFKKIFFLGTKENGLHSSYNGSSWDKVSDVPASSNVNFLYECKGILYAVTVKDGMYYRTSQNDWSKTETGPIDGYITCMASFKETLFAGTNLGTVYKLVNGKWSSIDKTISSKIVSLYEYAGTFYAGTESKGLYSSTDGSIWDQVSEVPPSSSVNFLYEFKGILYAIYADTEADGIYCYRTSKNIWSKFETEPINSSITCLVSFHGSLFAGTNNGTIYQLINNKWIRLKNKKISGEVVSLIVYSDKLYVVTASNGLWATEYYFGIPRNTQFLSYWDTIQQRLYNIRHGLTINGQTDDLPLFQPPVNPMALVAAIASGESVSAAIQSTNSVVPYYRFEVMINKAKEITQTVIQLGQSLLSALEKKDAEALAMLYNTNRQNILHLTQTIKQDQLTTAGQNITSLQKNLKGAQDRMKHYNTLISDGWLPAEEAQIGLAGSAIALQAIAEPIRIASIVGYSIPVIFGFSDGGMKFGDAINQGANILESAANVLNTSSGLAGTIASYQRRKQDWELQELMASDDINEIQYHITMAQYQEHIRKQEITVLEEQVIQENKVANFYVNKFTNEQLYQWYIGQVSALYFQAYQLAHEVAIQSENAWKFEHIGLASNGTSALGNFIKPGYWNSLHEGLLAGESLLLDLHRMEKRFTDQNVRRLEISKTISLAQLDPGALHNLMQTGTCVFDITEKDFAFDFPGHYCRQIKTISITIPMILGPYQNVHATLTQLTNKLVSTDDATNGIPAAEYLLNPNKGSQTPSLVVDLVPNQQVALSQGIKDTGMFELNFNDSRYLPFEGTGAVSSWQLEMPLENNAINFDSITDVIIEMKYTALQGSLAYKKAVTTARGSFSGTQVVSLAQANPVEWEQFLNSGNMTFGVHISKWRGVSKTDTVNILSLCMAESGIAPSNMKNITLTDGSKGSETFEGWSNNSGVSNLINPTNFTIKPGDLDQTELVLTASEPIEGLKNLVLILTYQVESQK